MGNGRMGILKGNLKGILMGILKGGYCSAGVDFDGSYRQYGVFVNIGGIFTYNLINDLIFLKINFVFLVQKQFLLRKYPLFPLLSNIPLFDYGFDLVFFLVSHVCVNHVVVFWDFGFVVVYFSNILVNILLETGF